MTSPLSIPPIPLTPGRPCSKILRADLAVLESSRPISVPNCFGVCREYRYGGTLVTLVEARRPGRDDPRTTEKDSV